MVTIEGEEEPVQMDVTWDNDVVTEEAGIFEFVGTLVLPEGYVNTNDVVVNLTLTVEEAAPTTEELATAAVVKAEETKTQEDVDAATALVVALEDETVKAELQGRLDVVQAEIDAAAEAALEEAKTTAKAELAGYVVAEDYTTNAEALTTALTAGETAIDEATTEEEVATALADAKLAIDEIKSDADLAAEALQAATDAVAKAEAGLLEARGTVEKDLADAEALVAELDQTASEVVLLNHRLSLVNSQVDKMVSDVESAVTSDDQIALDKALKAKVFADYDEALIAQYMTDLGTATTTGRDSIVKIQKVIDETNLTPGIEADAKLVADAVEAVDAAVTAPEADVTPAVTPAKTLVDAAQEAIDALPAVTDKVITEVGAAVDTELGNLDIELTATIGADLQEALNGAKAVRQVIKANNQLTLKTALSSSEFKRVNNDLLAEYIKGNATTVGIALDPAGDNTIYVDTSDATGKSVADVQTVIDTVNLAQATAAVTAADTTTATALTPAAINKAKALVNNLPEDTAGDTTKKDLQDKIDKAVAVANVKNATTEANLLAALKSEVLNLDNIDDTLAKFYKAKLDTEKDNINSAAYDVQASIVDAGNTAAIDEVVGKVDDITATTKLEDVKSLLTELKRLDGTNFTADINDLLLEDYRTDLVAGTITDTDSINTIIADANDPATALTTLEDSGSALDDADKLLAALQAKTLNLSIIEANKDAYFKDIAAIKTAAGTDADAVQVVVNATDARVALNKAANAEEARTAITKFAINEGIDAYLNLSAQGKLEVAGLVLAEKPEAGYAVNTALSTEVTDQVTALGTLIGDVNGATTITGMRDKLVALNYKPFADLSAAEKISVSEAFLNNVPKDENGDPIAYTSLKAIKADIDAAINSPAPMNN